MKRSIAVWLLATALIAVSVPVANATTVEFPCQGGTYSVSMPVGITIDGKKCGGSLVIDSQVRIIGTGSFGGATGSNLTSVVIPNTVTTIEAGAFSYSKSLTSVVIPNSVKEIGAYAFNRTNLLSLVVPSSVVSIGYGAFANNENLTFVDMSDRLENLWPEVFRGSNAIKEFLYCGTRIDWTFQIGVSNICPPGARGTAARKTESDANRRENADVGGGLSAGKNTATKKTTITCKKGTYIGNVTGINPKCPVGSTKISSTPKTALPSSNQASGSNCTTGIGTKLPIQLVNDSDGIGKMQITNPIKCTVSYSVSGLITCRFGGKISAVLPALGIGTLTPNQVVKLWPHQVFQIANQSCNNLKRSSSASTNTGSGILTFLNEATQSVFSYTGLVTGVSKSS
jgi:hypothetical protein